MSKDPVAWHYPNGKADQCTTDKEFAEMDSPWTPMYYKTEWVGLTDEEKQKAYLKIDTWNNCVNFIELTLREKNT